MPFTRAARVALSEASAWAKMQLSGEATVSGDLLLIALLHADDPLREHLEAMGLRLDRLEAAVLPEPGPPIEVEEERPAARQRQSKSTPPASRTLAPNRTTRKGIAASSRIIADSVLDDSFLCGELKQLRHDLTQALIRVARCHRLLEARENTKRCGSFSLHRSRTKAILARRRRHAASWKRLQEALRSLEEFGKTVGPDLESRRWNSCVTSLLHAGTRGDSGLYRRENGWPIFVSAYC